MAKAHNLEEKERTKDVLIDEDFNFNALLLSEPTLAGLKKNGFQKPSPIQLKAIPIGKCGFDLIVKSKSGTGKTLVFGLIALEVINVSKKHVQVLILAPTREVAVQIQGVVRDLGTEYKDLNVECFIGGLPIEEDIKKAQKCHIAVGAPGRVRHLIQLGVLNVKQVKVFVLDEVDKLMVQNGRNDIEEIILKLPAWKQTIAVSATLTKETEAYLEQCMSSPTLVEPTTESPLLLGIRQFVDIVKTNLNIVHQLDIKNKELIRLLSQISFTQCLVFTNYQTRAASVCNNLNRHGWNSMYISADQKQIERLHVMEALKVGKCRILLSTDLTARGIDGSHVDLTINYDVPYEASTYLHRMGRAGRYGTKGLCITIATEDELIGLKKLLGSIAGANFLIARLPKHGDLPADLINFDTKALQFEQSVIDLGNIPQESQNILSSVVDLKTSKIPKRTKRLCKKQEVSNVKDESQSESKDSSDICFQSPCQVESIDLQKASKIDVDSNARCFSEATTTGSDITLDRTELSDPCDNSDLKSLLTMLEATNTSSSASNSEINPDVSSDLCKKRKRSVTSPLKVQNEICNKNITLLHVAEILATPCATDIANENKSMLDQFMENTVKTVPSTQVVGTVCKEHKDDETNTPQKSKELGYDDIFKLSYNFAVKAGAPYWVDALGVNLQENVLLNEEPKEVMSLNRSPKKRHRFSKQSSNLETQPKMEKSRKSSNNSCDVKQTKSIHLNSLFADDSYSNTATDSLSNPTANLVQCQPPIEDAIQNIEKMDKSPTPNQLMDKLLCSEQLDHEYTGNQHYIDCFQKYSDELNEKLQTFEDMASFETWYEQWQWQVQSVRQYVQQNIYVKEMNRHMYGSP